MLCSENGVQDENDQKGKIFLLAGNDDMMTMGMRRMGKEKIRRWPFFWLDNKEYSVMLWSSKKRKSKRKYRRLCNQFDDHQLKLVNYHLSSKELSRRQKAKRKKRQPFFWRDNTDVGCKQDNSWILQWWCWTWWWWWSTSPCLDAVFFSILSSAFSIIFLLLCQ